MNTVDFKVDDKALATVKDLVITANFTETKEALTLMMMPYASLIVTEDGIASAKADRAKINKVITNIDDYRKMVKKSYSEPLKVFEDKCKELTKVCKDAVDNIDSQVKKYEAEKKLAKVNELKEYFNTSLTNAARGYVTFSDIFNKKWENSSMAVGDCHMEIERAISKTENDIAVIKALESEFEPVLLDMYKECHDISKCLLKNQQLNQTKREEEAKKQATTHRTQNEETVRTIPNLHKNVVPKEEKVVDVSDAVEVFSINFSVTATREQFAQLKAFFVANNIHYSKI